MWSVLQTEDTFNFYFRCSSDHLCNVYQYKENRPGDCLLILENSIDHTGHTLISTENNIIYIKITYFTFLITFSKGVIKYLKIVDTIKCFIIISHVQFGLSKWWSMCR